MKETPWPFTPLTPEAYLRTCINWDSMTRLDYKGAQGFFAGYLASCAYHPHLATLPLEVKETSSVDRSQKITRLVDPMEVVLCLSPPSIKPRNNWPSTLDEFGPLLSEYKEGANADLAAAMLLAAGANPWHDDKPKTRTDQDQLPTAISKMLEYQLSGLFAASLSHPKAWSVEALTSQPIRFRVGYEQVELLSYLTSNQNVSSMFGALCDHGFSIAALPDRRAHLLSAASPGAMEVLYSRGQLACLTATEIKEIQASWLRRVKASNLDSADLADMISKIDPGQDKGKINNLADTAEADALLSVAWSAGKVTFPSNLGVDGLLRTINSKTQLRGQWPVVSALAAAALRGSSGLGTPEVPFDRLLFYGPGPNPPGNWLVANPTDPKWQAALAPALSVEWRPGISSAAPLALAVLSAANTDPVRANYQLGVANLFGISDLGKWAGGLASSMVEFTTQTLKPRATAQQGVMLRAWSRMLSGSPMAVGREVSRALSSQEKYELLFALTGAFSLSAPWHAVDSSGYKKMFDSVTNILSATKGHDEYAGLAQLVVDLASASPSKALDVVMSLDPALPATEVSRIFKAWTASRRNEDDFLPVVSKMKSQLLSRHVHRPENGQSTHKVRM